MMSVNRRYQCCECVRFCGGMNARVHVVWYDDVVMCVYAYGVGIFMICYLTGISSYHGNILCPTIRIVIHTQCTSHAHWET